MRSMPRMITPFRRSRSLVTRMAAASCRRRRRPTPTRPRMRALIARVVVGSMGSTGFDAYPLVDPAIVGDASGNGGASLSAFDTSLIAQESAGINTPEVPDETAPGSGGSVLYDPQLSIPDNIPVATGHTHRSARQYHDRTDRGRYHLLDVYRQVPDRRIWISWVPPMATISHRHPVGR